MRRERGIHEFFAEDPKRADRELWGRGAGRQTRRTLLANIGAMSAVLGARIVHARHIPVGLIPAQLANSREPFHIEGKDGLTVLNDRPLSAETPPHLLNDDVTPSERLFVRNNGLPPDEATLSRTWALTVSGESVLRPLRYTIAGLKRRFAHVRRQLVLECAGNGRVGYDPPVPGTQWTLGAVGCPEWNGVLLRDVLADCGIARDAVYVAYWGADTHLAGPDAGVPISRGVPIAKALRRDAMIAWGMNGQPLHPMNGSPLRLVFGGWPGSTSGKWLTGISVRNIVHDGPKMGGQSYRMPCEPVEPGAVVADEDMCIIGAMPVKSLITDPPSGIRHPFGHLLNVHGHAWAGDRTVRSLWVSIDFGRRWRRATLWPPTNQGAWANWDFAASFPTRGYYEVWARAIDDRDRSQPMIVPGWNPKGYLNNACHRIAVHVV
ncbi:MAG: sulfite oxidase [Gammaproteobacteria bacterium]|nr:sulfite oxidase [Gammaproteobacteria bacterium]